MRGILRGRSIEWGRVKRADQFRGRTKSERGSSNGSSGKSRTRVPNCSV